LPHIHTYTHTHKHTHTHSHTRTLRCTHKLIHTRTCRSSFARQQCNVDRKDLAFSSKQVHTPTHTHACTCRSAFARKQYNTAKEDLVTSFTKFVNFMGGVLRQALAENDNKCVLCYSVIYMCCALCVVVYANAKCMCAPASVCVCVLCVRKFCEDGLVKKGCRSMVFVGQITFKQQKELLLVIWKREEPHAAVQQF